MSTEDNRDSTEESPAEETGRSSVSGIYVLGSIVIGFVAAATFSSNTVETKPTAPAPQHVTQTARPATQAPAPQQPASNKLTCPRKEFPSCEAARKVFYQMKNNRYLHGDEAACRHAAAAWFLDDLCGGPG